ncbi:PREDICTED: protein stum homolog [Dipodomys ordii]|uniref:Protein stum homolog n=1 Tax=Dipodomys ordii TaxID=10020 RepID=A0A1S3FA40_DIPOR|nr:PREDICTED: protein stum homolog [Dipodomys ordii]
MPAHHVPLRGWLPFLASAACHRVSPSPGTVWPHAVSPGGALSSSGARTGGHGCRCCHLFAVGEGGQPPSDIRPLTPAGTFLSAFAVLCGARTDLPDRHVCCVFCLNVAAALIQVLTAIVMVGWIMSIFWGMDMVILAISQGYKEQGVPQQL